MTRLRGITLLAVLLVALAIAIGPRATASTSTSGGVLRFTDVAEEHCAARATPRGQPVQVSAPVCFALFSDAIAFATGGAVQLPVDAPSGDHAALRNQVGPQTTYVIGIDWEHSYKGGNAYIWYMDSPCTGSNGALGQYPADWNDRVSSAEAYSGCTYFGHYEHINWTGAVINCGTYCPIMGVMNDQSSSVSIG